MRPLTESPEPGVVQFNWNGPQSQFKQIRGTVDGPLEYINYEGAVRTGKTTAPASKACDYAIEYPGIHLAAARWKDLDLWGQVVPAWRDMVRRYGLRTIWHPDEQYDEIVGTTGTESGHNSRMYLRALHTNELDSRYSKLAGLTLAVLWIDQPEEVPQDVIDAYVPARLSQPHYPRELWLTPNPVDETDHWLAKWFPADRALLKPHHWFIQTALRDNVDGVGEQYIADMEAKYPPGHALRRRFIEGLRGLSIVGDPVYGTCFNRRWHVDETVRFNASLPLLEAWDFGHHHPAVLWSQYVQGAWHVLGEVMGHDQFIEDFAPWVIQQRTVLCPGLRDVWSCCDPARNNQGLAHDALSVLQAHQIFPRYVEGSNGPILRDAAIQRLSAALLRVHNGLPAVRVHPRCRVFIDGLEAGYVWDRRSIANSVSPNTRRPLKDGTYDHLQNCSEYTWLNFGPAQLTGQEADRMQARMERAIEKGRRDIDPSERRRSASGQVSRGPRGGYS